VKEGKLMVTEIVGKQHICGISAKTGKAYDFCDIYYLGRRKNVEGLAAVKKTVGADVVAADDITIGGMYDLTVDDEGNIIEVHKVSTSASSQQTKT
jgi:hypothetical protein